MENWIYKIINYAMINFPIVAILGSSNPISPQLTYSKARAVPNAILTREFHINGLLYSSDT